MAGGYITPSLYEGALVSYSFERTEYTRLLSPFYSTLIIP